MAGLVWGTLPGAAVAGLALSVGVTVAAVVAGGLARSAARELAGATDRPPLDTRRLVGFYTPLAMTSFLVLGGGPLINFGLGRAPDELAALAVWPVILGLLFVTRSGAYAYQEVVVALAERPAAADGLRSFAWILGLGLTALLGLVAVTPLSDLWLGSVAGLTPALVAVARPALVAVIPAPGLSAIVAWRRGLLVAADRTPVVTQAVAVNLAVLGTVMYVGLVSADRWPGATVAGLSLSLSLAAEVLWLHFRSGS
jgi:hypothetical protein